ncbi:MAG: tRNA-dihydrouridine synthase [Woeseiaceae bacterium]
MKDRSRNYYDSVESRRSSVSRRRMTPLRRLYYALGLPVLRGLIPTTDLGLPDFAVTAVVGAVSVPVSLKTRTGWDPDNRNGVRVARLAEDCGVQALAIHGRTRACRFAGSAEYETIARIVEAVSIPVVANGDIDGPEKALEVLRLTGAAAVMIGRAAQGRPWIFRDVLSLLRDGRHARPLDGNERRDIIVAHLGDMHRFYGEERGVRVARKHLSWYCRYLSDADAYRKQVLRVESAREQLLLTERYFGGPARDGALAA